ncbi:MAG: AAA family ATPase [Armatimonadetes bacterium]|nr:AAA family ATPase [Armatimonadota bacterium]
MAAQDTDRAIEIIITEPQPGASDSLRALLSEAGGGTGTDSSIQVLGVARDGLEAAQMAAQLSPDLILLHEELPGMTGYEASEMIALAAPDVAAVLLVSPENMSEATLQRALRAGARAVIPADASAETVGEVLQELAQLREGRSRPEYELVTDRERMPVMISVTGAKGGIGKTTIVTNLAVSFARRYSGQVALVDFYGQFGNIPLMLDLHPSGNIAELASFADELDINVIEKNLVTHEESGLKVLAGTAQSGGLSAQLSPEQEVTFLAELVGILRRHYRFLFFDVPPLLGRASTYIFSRSQYIILITALIDLSTVQDTATLYNQLLEAHLSPERIKVVINRAARHWTLTTEDLERTLNAKVALQIPDDQSTALASINEGVPAVISRGGTPLARGVQQLGQIIEDALAAERQ